MVVYPLTTQEDRMVRWASRIVPAMAIAVIVFLGACSLATLQA